MAPAAEITKADVLLLLLFAVAAALENLMLADAANEKRNGDDEKRMGINVLVCASNIVTSHVIRKQTKENCYDVLLCCDSYFPLKESFLSLLTLWY